MNRLGSGPLWGGVTTVYMIILLAAGRLYPGIGTISADWKTAGRFCGTLLLVCGMVIYLTALRRLNRGLREGRLVTDGLFGVVRHPVYAAWIIFILPGFALMMNSWLMLTVPLVAYGAFRAVISREDRELEKAFGDDYREYRKKTAELILKPKWRIG